MAMLSLQCGLSHQFTVWQGFSAALALNAQSDLRNLCTSVGHLSFMLQGPESLIHN